ncbi:sulfurtransferase [Aspergillus saccharolyticus JOP 1030-1]|uniref:Rhodanese-related sulfurtransferase n=1 Tax=Aspergillus saccharolyticus JOP 1030-1 TaxID=1450539 RepID=A0A318ZBN6_9EURO|nr:rhodanese-related sulfurtransferase [Aspergillus saccharolyticus JOP 1030-1]PYH44719.1 rhodanese-related sulfurtransferase [Aspergillus saccharolyticus JOP 1030-1]
MTHHHTQSPNANGPDWFSPSLRPQPPTKPVLKMTDPFPTYLITPTEYHNVVANQPPSTSTRRIVPLAAGRPTLRPAFEAQHLPGSKFFDQSLIRDATSPYPLMLPTAEGFAAAMTALDIRPSDVLVIYDTYEIGTYSAPRVAWMCAFFGHGAVHVLNNFRVYADLGFPVSSGGLEGAVTREPGDVYPVPLIPDPNKVISYEEVKRLVGNETSRIVDARIAGRFSGNQSEEDTSLRSGHIPGAVNVPLARLLDETSKVILPASKLKDIFEKAGLPVTNEAPQWVLTCNSGVTAAALDLALSEIGAKGPRRLYDGSWMEWTRRAEKELVVTDSR